MRKALMLSVFVGLLAAGSVFAADVSTAVEAEQAWDGKVADEGLHRLKPKHGFIASKGQWRRLWKSWRPTETMPPIDFDHHIIIVGTVPGPNRVAMKATLSTAGDLTFTEAGTKIGGPGFGYAIQKVASDGIQSVNGQALKSE